MADQVITNKAVVFFDSSHAVVKEMLYTEFEAVLDHIVGISEFEAQKINAVYLHINEHLQATAAVFFQIDFDSKGYADKKWNMPLDHLAEGGDTGPNLGAGPIRLSCKSRCSVDWHKHEMWNPDPEHKVFRRLKAVVKRNRLSLPFTEPGALTEGDQSSKSSGDAPKKSASIEVDKDLKQRLSENFMQELKERTREASEEYKLKMASLKSEAQEHIEKIHRQYREETKKLTETLDVAKQLFTEEKQKNIKLKETLDKEADALRMAREGFQKDLVKDKDLTAQKLQQLETRFELELNASVETATAELKERLEMREVELFYRDEQLTGLREDVSKLREEKMALQAESGDELIQRISDAGINFIVHKTGEDPFTIPAADVSQFLDSPVDYMAKFYGVDADLYVHWLEHHELPVCNHIIAGGNICGQPVEKIHKPTQFIANKSDRCSTHGALNDAIISMMKLRERA